MPEFEKIAAPLIEQLSTKHPLVANKLLLAKDQLIKANSIEEFQQIGILIRDAWIEFGQKLYAPDVVQDIRNEVGWDDSKKIIQAAVRKWREVPEGLEDLFKSSLSLALKVHHSRNIDCFSVQWCLILAAVTMVMFYELDSMNHDRLGRRYYKCPQCGSLRLTCKHGQECDFDGPGPEYEVWKCGDCDWEHFLYLN